MKPWIIGITDYVKPPFSIEQAVFGHETEFVDLEWDSGVPNDLENVRSVDALLVWHAHIDERVAAAAERCQIVVRYGVGVDNLNVGALEDHGIAVCNTPDYGVEEVADTTLALIMGLHRGVFCYDEEARWHETGWQEHVLRSLKRSRDTVVGVVGLGRIGSSVALRLRAFGFQVVGFDPYVSAGHEKVLGCDRVNSLSELQTKCEIVTLHCSLTKETMGMVDATFLSGMRPGSILVNTARGGLLSALDDIEAALRSGHLGGVGLDVLPEEPPGEGTLIQDWRAREPWLRGRMIVTPHTAYFSVAAWTEMRQSASETARRVLSGGQVRNRVRPAEPLAMP